MLILCLHSNGIRVPQCQRAQNVPVIFPYTWYPFRVPSLKKWHPHLSNHTSQNPRVNFNASCHCISINPIPSLVSSYQVLHSVHLPSSFLWHCLILLGYHLVLSIFTLTLQTVFSHWAFQILLGVSIFCSLKIRTLILATKPLMVWSLAPILTLAGNTLHLVPTSQCTISFNSGTPYFLLYQSTNWYPDGMQAELVLGRLSSILICRY